MIRPLASFGNCDFDNFLIKDKFVSFNFEWIFLDSKSGQRPIRDTISSIQFEWIAIQFQCEYSKLVMNSCFIYGSYKIKSLFWEILNWNRIANQLKLNPLDSVISIKSFWMWKYTKIRLYFFFEKTVRGDIMVFFNHDV